MVDELFDALAEVYDWIQTFKGDIPFWINQAKRNDGPVLELGCGTGRTTWEIATAGVPIVGLDSSEAMLRVAESKRELHPDASSVILKKSKINEFELGIKFNTIIIPNRTFELAQSKEEQQQIFASCNKHLNPKGNLVLFLLGPPTGDITEGLEQLQKTVINPTTGNKCRLFVKDAYDWQNQLSTHYQRLEEIEGDGTVLREWKFPPIKYHWITAQELENLGREVNFKVVARFSDWLRRPYQEGDACMIYVYEKQ